MTSPIIVALDLPDEASARNLVDRLDASMCRLKVGKEMFTRLGPDFVRSLAGRGFDVFLDLKFHDIPNTVARACVAAAELGVWMMNVHASGGRRMMEAAREALAAFDRRPRLIGVTVLTSLAAEELGEIGFAGTPEENVRRLARLASASGLDGVVCSPHEAAILRADLGDDFLLVTPGVRPAGSAIGDQRRVMTPADAMAAGSSFLVIGRPITAAPDPLAALHEIAASLV
jgi:orotidine-5'-phosphate decarboxylase